jgi:hypothetical protein
MREEWEATLNRNYLACGCSASSSGLLLGILAGPLLLVFRAFAGASPPSLLQSGGIVVGLAVAGAVVGKLAGLIAANARLKAVVAIIQDNWKDQEPAGAAKVYWG